MKKIIYWIGRIALLAFLVLGYQVSSEAAEDAPQVVKTQVINDRDIELYWDQEVSGADLQDSFQVFLDGKEVPIFYYKWEDYDYELRGVVYFGRRTSIRLENALPSLEQLPDIEIAVKEHTVKGVENGIYVPAQRWEVSHYQPFYTDEITLDCGVKVKGTANVKQGSLQKAVEILEIMLGNQDIAGRMGQAGCCLGVYGTGEIAYDIPEHRYEYDGNYLYVEGFGGTQLASIRDSNVLRQQTGTEATSYPNECILVHEFGHTVKNYGLSSQQLSRLNSIYEASRERGRWDNTYAGSNVDEYFATLSAIWFDVMDDTWDGNWDGVRGPVNTRAELKVYDPEAYEFLKGIYPSGQYLPEPWQKGSVPDLVTYPGTEKEEKPETEEEIESEAQKQTERETENETQKQTEQESQQQTDRETEKGTGQTEPIKKVITPKIVWKSVKRQKGNRVRIVFRKIHGVKKYEILLARDKKFKKGKKTKLAASNSCTLKVSRKEKWYIKVRAWKLDDKGRRIYGKYSSIRRIPKK